MTWKKKEKGVVEAYGDDVHLSIDAKQVLLGT